MPGLTDVPGEAAALYNLGYMALIAGDLDDARRLYSAARDIHERLGDRAAYAYDGLGLGLVAMHRSEWAAAIEVHEETAGIFRDLGDRWGLGNTLVAVGRAHREVGQLHRAEELNREALDIFREAGDLSGIAMVLGATGALRVVQGRLEAGLRLAGAARAIEDEIGGGVPAGVVTYEDARELAAGRLEPDAIARTWESGRSLSIDQAADLMLEGT